MRFLLSSFCLILTVAVTAQFETHYDTLTLTKSPLSKLDSVDIKYAELPSVFDGGLQLSGRAGFSLTQLYRLYSMRWFEASPEYRQMKFSALPFLGFTYSFGSQATQFVRGEYIHAFNDSLILNVDFKRDASNGYIRNATYLNNDANLQLIRKGELFSFALKGSYFTRSVDHPGGLTTDSLVVPFGLEFSPVRKSNAHSDYKRGDVFWNNYFDLLPSQESSFGVMTATHYSITNRKYQEIDSIDAIYPVVNINPDTTFDQFNLPSISNGAGVFFNRPKFYFDARIDHTYWRYSNLHLTNDTNEVDFNSTLHMNISRVQLSNELKLNLSGAFNGWSENASISYSDNRLQANFNVRLAQQALEPFKRFYYANNYSYKTQGSLKELTIFGKGAVRYTMLDSILAIQAGLNHMVLKDHYFFNGYEWRNDTLTTLNATSIELKVPFSIRWFNIHPVIVYTATNSPHLPEWQLYSRVYYQSRLFKAKKLNFMIGTDVAYNTAYNVTSYIPSLDVIDVYNASNTISNSRVNMHAFVNFGISDFKFYFRFENIAYYWENKLRVVAENYPMAGPRMRIGLSWRFFN